jgi:hypothetical protein
MVSVVAALSGVVYAVSCSFYTGGVPTVSSLVASGVLRILLDVFGAWGPVDPPRRFYGPLRTCDVGGLLKANSDDDGDDVFFDH